METDDEQMTIEKNIPLHTSPFHYARMYGKVDWLVEHDPLCHTLEQ